MNSSDRDSGRGQVVTWFEDKGYGFIRPETGGTDCFLHVKELFPHQRRPRVGDQVSYRATVTAPDKSSAACVRIHGFAWSGFSLFCMGLLPLSGAYAACVWRGILPFYPVASFYAGVSLMTIAAYFIDKRSALLGTQRLSESFLHHLELLGGWPGALLAQCAIHHKSSKRAYQITFWLIVLMHGGAWCAWYAGVTPSVVFQRLDQTVHAYETRRRERAAAKPSPLAEMAADSSNRISQALSQRLSPPGEPTASPDTGKPRWSLSALSSLFESPPATGSEQRDVGLDWASDAPTEPPLDEPHVCRTRLIASAQNRQTVGVVQAISPSRGILVEMPAEFHAQGIISPNTLIRNFHRHFYVGEQVNVAITGVTMSRKSKTFDLLLVESPTRLANTQPPASNQTRTVTKRLIPAPPRVR